jgi:hypothetical protein
MNVFSNARSYICAGAFLLAAYTCLAQAGNPGSAALIEEIRRVEKQFEHDVNTRGVDVAFEKYAAPDAVIKRQNDTLIYGPKAIKLYYSTEFYKSAKAYWAPDYISVSVDGTMAYTYGKYRWTFPAKRER